MDERTAGVKRGRPVALAMATPSPSRRRRRRVGSSPGCVPRANSLTTTPTRTTMMTTPPPRRLLPPTSQASANRARRTRAAPVLRLDDDDEDDDDEMEDGDGVSTGDDSLSIISGDGSPERDRHVLEFLTLADGAPVFSLFTPSPSAVKTNSTARSMKRELIGGAFTPQTSPARSHSGSSANTSPSRFLRSPYASRKTNSSSAPTTPTRESDENQQLTANHSPQTPPVIKTEPMEDAIAFSVRSTPTSSVWRRNSLSLMRTPSPAASARARMLRAKARAAQLAKATGRDPFNSDDDDELDASSDRRQRLDELDANYAPGLRSGQDQDWFFSFANTLSPLGPGVATGAEDDLENSFVSLRFSPVAPSSCIDLQRLLPPFPSPALGPVTNSPFRRTSLTPVRTPTSSPGIQRSVGSGPSSSGSSSTGSSTSSASKLLDAFPNIRASTSATPGRDERLKLATVMTMKLHVSFDEAHAKRELEDINNSLKRRKQSRKRKASGGSISGEDRVSRANGKASVQRKLLQTPVKGEARSPSPATAAAAAPVAAVEAQDSTVQQQQTQQPVVKARTAQRQLLVGSDDADSSDGASAPPSSSSSSSSTDSMSSTSSTGACCHERTPSWRRRLSPVFGTLSTPTLPPFGKHTTPTLHALQLRKPKAPASVISPPAPPTALAPPPPPPPPPPSVQPASSATPPAPAKPPATTTVAAAASPVIKREPLSTPSKPPFSTASEHAHHLLLLQTPVSSSVVDTVVDIVKKKAPCNCKKSKCLKLYCECFASGGYCDESCNCVGCANTPADEALRQKAIASRLEKNPNAFKPKIESAAGGGGFSTPHAPLPLPHLHHAAPLLHPSADTGSDVKKMHKHGCHCKKSACQKRYCECFQAGVPCGDNCRCIDCKNQSPCVAKHHLHHHQFAHASALPRPPPPPPLPSSSSSSATSTSTTDDSFFSPPLPSIRQRLRIDRETWARNFTSPFEVSPRRNERLRAQQKNSLLLRSFVKTEPPPAFASPPASQLPSSARSLSPVSDATRPPPAPSPPHLKDQKPAMPRNAHVLEALASSASSASSSSASSTAAGSRVFVLPLFGDALPPVKEEVGAHVLRFLTNADVYNASLVNRLWSRVTMGDAVWDHATFRRAERREEEAL